jgi:hypothetical protein
VASPPADGGVGRKGFFPYGDSHDQIRRERIREAKRGLMGKMAKVDTLWWPRI